MKYLANENFPITSANILKENGWDIEHIYLRIKKFTPEYPANLLLELITEGDLEVEAFFTVIDDNQIRQRKIK